MMQQMNLMERRMEQVENNAAWQQRPAAGGTSQQSPMALQQEQMTALRQVQPMQGWTVQTPWGLAVLQGNSFGMSQVTPRQDQTQELQQGPPRQGLPQQSWRPGVQQGPLPSFLQGLPQPLSQGLVQGLPQALPQVLLAQSLPQGLPQGLQASALLQGWPQSPVQGQPQGLPQALQQGLPQGLPGWARAAYGTQSLAQFRQPGPAPLLVQPQNEAQINQFQGIVPYQVQGIFR